MSSSSLDFGDIVELRGLTSDAGRALNGLKGIVLGSAPGADDRLQVHIAGQASFKALKPANLRRVFDTYAIKQESTIPGAGRGMFAARDINPGEEIVSEKALLDAEDADHAAVRNHASILLDRLSPSDRTVFKHLHPLNQPIDSENEGESDTTTELTQRQTSSVINTNQFAFAGLLFVCSMPNHCCLENASFEFDEDRKLQVIYAVRPIKAGEEILLNYTGDINVRAIRAAKLLPKGFFCKCALCTHPDSNEIDKLIEEVHELRDMYPRPEYHDRAEMMGNRIVAVCKILIRQYGIESARRLCAMTCGEMVEMLAQLDVQRGVGSSSSSSPIHQDPKTYERAMKWIDINFTNFLTPGTYPSTSAKWNRKIKKIREFQQNPSSFYGYLVTGTFPRVMNGSSK